MASADQEATVDPQRESDSAPDPEGKRLLSGECRDPVTGVLYAFTFFLPTATADDLAAFPHVLHGIFESAGLECSVSLRSTSRAGDWDGR